MQYIAEPGVIDNIEDVGKTAVDELKNTESGKECMRRFKIDLTAKIIFSLLLPCLILLGNVAGQQTAEGGANTKAGVDGKSESSIDISGESRNN